jgi:hypothetical protein
MATLTGDGRIDPALVAPLDRSGGLPSSVSTRIQLDGGSIEAGVPSDETYRHDWFEFRGSGQQAPAGTDRHDPVEPRCGEADAVVIEITPVSGGPGRQLVFKPRIARHQIFISNMPVEVMVLRLTMRWASKRWRHAPGAYYKLLKNPLRTNRSRGSGSGPQPRRGGRRGPVACPPASSHGRRGP